MDDRPTGFKSRGISNTVLTMGSVLAGLLLVLVLTGVIDLNRDGGHGVDVDVDVDMPTANAPARPSPTAPANGG